jgi:hypothetical protein
MPNSEPQNMDFLYPALDATCGLNSPLLWVHLAVRLETSRLTSISAQQRRAYTGDVVNDLHQLSVAFGQAAIAATSIHNSYRLIPVAWQHHHSFTTARAGASSNSPRYAAFHGIYRSALKQTVD